MIKTSTIKFLLAGLLLATPVAQAVTLDFEGFGNGTNMDTDYQLSHGVTIITQNFSTDPNYGAFFDTTLASASPDFAADSDLIGNFNNTAPTVVPVPSALWLFGTALIGFIGFSRRTSV